MIIILALSVVFTTYMNLITQQNIVKKNLLNKSEIINLANSAIIFEQAKFLEEKENGYINYQTLCEKNNINKLLNGKSYVLNREYLIDADNLEYCKIEINIPYTINTNNNTINENQYLINRNVY